jgi:CrcB protein
VGAPLRYLVESLANRNRALTDFPRGLFMVNVMGSALAGIVVAATSGNLRLMLLVGLCGAFTTFSTFAAELAGLVNDRSSRLLVQWTVAMVIGGGVAAAVGIAIGRSW